jgi:uncharacterized protein YceK
MKLRKDLVRGLVLLVLAAVAIAVSGCASTTDASDPDPNYYKGKQFTHKRTG